MSHDYDSLAANLLAEIADALLGQKKDWSTLERLQAALIAPKGTERLKAVHDSIMSVHDKGIYGQLKPISVPREMVEGISYGYTSDFSTTNTANLSQYYIKGDSGKT